MTITIEIPIALPSLKNCRFGHWAQQARVTSSQRYVATNAVLCQTRRCERTLPATVIITRCAPRAMDDDNMQRAASAIRDGVAAAFGVDDGADGWAWVYRQEVAKKPSVRIEIKSRDGNP